MTLFSPGHNPPHVTMPARVCFRIEEEFRARARQLELQPRLRPYLDPLRNADLVADRKAFLGSEARFAEGGSLHEKAGFENAARRARGPIGLWSYGD